MTNLLIATRNAHKTKEIQTILSKKVRCLTLNDFPSAPEVVEDGKTFVDNAKKKAIELASWIAKNPGLLFEKAGEEEMRLYILADDSGLEVDALEGAPGVYSARFAALDKGIAGNSPDGENNAKLLELLDNVPADKRTARFRCVLALTQVPFTSLTKKSITSTTEGLANYTKTFEGKCEGRIAMSASGKGGFGYDPLFIPNGQNKSFAELGDKKKNEISHRSQALARLAEHLQSR